MLRYFIVIFILLLPHFVRSQEDICIGKRYTLYSDTLHEERDYWVYLPDGYGENAEETYPVIYLLDGDSFFHALVGMQKSGSTGRNRSKGRIIVGVLNVDRTRDLTPSASAAGRDGKITEGAKKVGGGAESFAHYLKDELREVIDNKYRTNGENMLIGHSYAGLFTLYAFFYHTDWFDSYLAVDPSLWWDQGKLVNDAPSLLEGKDYSGKKLYIAIASAKRTDRVNIQQEKAHPFLEEIMPKAVNLQFVYKFFPEEVHGTVPIPGFYDGIKQLYKK